MKNRGAKLVRINPTEADGPAGTNSIKSAAFAAVREISRLSADALPG